MNNTPRLAPILLASFLATAGAAVFAFALPLMSMDEKISGSWLGSAFALYFLARLLAAPLGGIWTDKAGPRSPFMSACILGLLAPLAYLLSPTLPMLMTVQMLLGISSGIARPASLASIAALAAPDNQPLWLGRNTAISNAALMLGPLAGGLLYLDRSMQPVLYGVMACMGLALLAGLWLPKITTQAKPEQEPATPACKLLPLLLAIAGRTIGIGAMIAFYPLLLAQSIATNSLTLALIFITANLASLLLLPLAGKRMQGMNLGLMTVLGMLISALALFSFGLVSSPWQFVVLGIVMGFGSALSLPASMALTAGMSRLSPYSGKLFGTAQGAAGIGFLLGPMLGGLAVQWTSTTGAALTLAAMAGLILTLPLLFTKLRAVPGWSRAYTGLTSLGCVSALALLSLFSGLLPASQNDDLYRHTDMAMGTVIRLTLDAPNRMVAERASRDAMDLIRRMQQDLDHRSPSGSIWRINNSAGKQPVAVTPQALALIQRSLNFARLTEGQFDPTVGAITTLPFYFGLDPSIAESKKQLVDYRKVRVNGNTVMLERQSMALDLGGIAKGTIIDKAVKALQAMNISSGMVEAGGDFYVFGDRDWIIGVQDPRGEDNQTLEMLTLRNRALCTSGDYRRYVMLQQGGEPRRHHILNPDSMASASGAISVSVIASTAEEADALATALFVMGPERGLAFLKSYTANAQAQWITPDLRLISSPGFPSN